MKVADLLYDAALDAGIVGIENPLAPAVTSFLLRKLNRIVDNWNADQRFVYGESFTTFNLTQNHNPHTIGIAASGADFIVAGNRPESIEWVNIIINSVTPSVTQPLRKRDWRWWADQRIQTLSTAYPTDFYYEAGVGQWEANSGAGVGQLYLWAVPNKAWPIQLVFRGVITQFTLAQTFSLPPGYQDALQLTLSEDIGPAFNQPPTPELIMKASQARARLFDHMHIPTLDTADSGLSTGRSQFLNWQTGLMAR